jgi:hypothetical protein
MWMRSQLGGRWAVTRRITLWYAASQYEVSLRPSCQAARSHGCLRLIVSPLRAGHFEEQTH